MTRAKLVAAGLCFILCLTSADVFSQVKLMKGQTVYVPAYANVFTGPRGNVFHLTVTLVIRNTDPRRPIVVTAADYIGTSGRLEKKFVDRPVTLGPMASTHFLITEAEASGGIGANFIVRWKAETDVNVPIIEAVMIGARSGQGISFVAVGQEISE